MATWKAVTKGSWVGADGRGLAPWLTTIPPMPLSQRSSMSQTLRGWRKGGWSLSPDPCLFIQTPSWTRLRPGALLISLETWRLFFTIILDRRKCPLRINFDLQGHFLPWIHFIGLRRSILLLSGHVCHICMCICIYAFHVCHILSAVWILPLRSNSVPTPHPLQILLNLYIEERTEPGWRRFPSPLLGEAVKSSLLNLNTPSFSD